MKQNYLSLFDTDFSVKTKNLTDSLKIKLKNKNFCKDFEDTIKNKMINYKKNIIDCNTNNIKPNKVTEHIMNYICLREAINNIYINNKKLNCPKLLGSDEELNIYKILYELQNKIYPNMIIIPQKKIFYTKTKFLRCDFFIILNNNKLIIEYDGYHHYNYRTKLYRYKQVINDNRKLLYSIENNISLLRIYPKIQNNYEIIRKNIERLNNNLIFFDSYFYDIHIEKNNKFINILPIKYYDENNIRKYINKDYLINTCIKKFNFKITKNFEKQIPEKKFKTKNQNSITKEVFNNIINQQKLKYSLSDSSSISSVDSNDLDSIDYKTKQEIINIIDNTI